MNIGIVGLGLIGGSMAKSIKKRTGHSVYGIDLDGETMELARMCGAIDGPLTEQTLPKCHIVLLAVRPGAAISWTREHASAIAGDGILVDLCGVKRVVVEGITPIARQWGFTYVGGHPMAGRERGGFASSVEDLYVGASMILTPDEQTDPEKLETVKHFFLDLGFGGITFSTPEEHDRIIAFTSQLAHVVSNAYIKSPTAELHKGFSAGSYKDMTRVAWLAPEMWAELFLENKDFLMAELDTLMANLRQYQDAMVHNDLPGLVRLLDEGRKRKEEVDGR